MCVCVCVRACAVCVVCVCVCVCDPLEEHVVANSTLYVVTVNGRDVQK